MILFKFFILGALTSLMYPPFFIFPLGFIIFPYLVYSLSKLLYKTSFAVLFFYGYFYGVGFLIIYLSWIYNPFLVYENTKQYFYIAFLLPIFLSLFFGLGFLIYKLFKNHIFLILVTPFILILIEFFISNFIYGFPWISHSLILSNNILGLKLIKYFGTITSGYLVISIFLFPSLLFYCYKKKNFIILLLLIYSPLVFVIIIPIISIFSITNNISKEIDIDAYQISTPITKVDKNKIEKNIIKIINNSKSDYIIFAENNLPHILDKNKLSYLNKFIKNDKKVIIGASTFKDGEFFNSFILLEKNKTLFFDKKLLVPFGEFLPFRKYLKFMEYITGNIDFNTGKKERILTPEDNIRILPVICYEIIFDQIFTNVNKKEIDIIINITNDSWFGNKIGPYQHFYISRTKTLIANKPLIRVSNNGISAIIDNNGKIIKVSKLNQVANLKYKLNLKNNISYFYLHKLLSWFLLSLFIFIFIYNKKIYYEK